MNKIITCIDGSALSSAVCNAGTWAAKKLNKPLLLLHAIEKDNLAVNDDLSGSIGLGARSSLLNEMVLLDEKRGKIALELGKEILKDAAISATNSGCTNIEKTQRHSSVVEAICDLEDSARLIVIGRSGSANGDNFKAIGSHIEQIIRQVSTPVLIANKEFTQPNSFMLAYDGLETATDTVKKIIAGGLLNNLTCHLVTVKNNQDALNTKFEETKHMLIEHGFNVQASLLEGDIFNALMEYKETNHVDMLVMGAFSHSRLASVFLGSNTLKMIENTHLPLVILR